jgi:hypothetical protein
MIKTIAQTKALIRATDLSDRLNLLTDITLEHDDEQIIRFCENYRMLLGAEDRKKQVASDQRIQAFIDSAYEEKSDEIHSEKE